MAEVELRSVRKSFGATKVIHGVDIKIADGELVVIVGPSGCGKSTLLRMVAGLETVSEGTVAIDGVPVNDREPKDRDIAMVFQNYALYPHMSVYDNMAYGLRNRGMARDEIDRRVRAAAQTLELAHLLERKPRQLSGGQRQRVAMGRAIVREPKAFLFDEPLSNLDAKLRVQMRVEIKKLQRQLGVTSLYVTHDQVEAMTLADRLIVMNAGVAEQIGTPMELYARPATTFVGGFIGSPAMNFFPGRAANGRVELEGGIVLAMPNTVPSGDVTVGIRPEHMTLGGGPGASLPLKVELIEHLGAEALVYGRLPGGAELTARIDGESDVAVGSQLALSVDPRHVHLFGRADGKRLA
ncbi:MAG: sn-glycerol-3-phosphate import ATP-binding protein UgpC [Alphaproteobacteria bacterium]|nr:sn-glycerol-3-phosphate import ATP-binding protein UgpC [Alphaproteobacteria bacterium]